MKKCLHHDLLLIALKHNQVHGMKSETPKGQRFGVHIRHVATPAAP